MVYAILHVVLDPLDRSRGLGLHYPSVLSVQLFLMLSPVLELLQRSAALVVVVVRRVVRTRVLGGAVGSDVARIFGGVTSNADIHAALERYQAVRTPRMELMHRALAARDKVRDASDPVVGIKQFAAWFDAHQDDMYGYDAVAVPL